MYFFLSYARSGDDLLVKQFFQGLSAELRRRTGVAADEAVGFLDTGIGIGIRWSSALQQALSSCQVFLPLYSARYFKRVYCRREWAFFAERLRLEAERTGVQPESIIPVTWVPMSDRLPDAAAAINHHDETFGAEYANRGLYSMLRVQRLQDDYHEFLVALATKIINAARLHPLPALDPATARAVEAFSEHAEPWPLPAGAPDPAADVAGMEPTGPQPAISADGSPRVVPAAPSVWRVPTRTAAFTGRDGTLERLHAGLAAGTTVVLQRALFGLGGVGKTQLAIEYAHRYAADYDLVWWVPAEQPALIRSALAELAPQLAVASGATVAGTAEAVLDVLRRGRPFGRWLLIFDNADEPRDLARYLPHGAGHVLVTSRNQQWAAQFEHIEVDVFSREESVALLTRQCRGLDPADADRIAAALGDLPLAVSQAGAWLETSGMSVEVYLKLLQTEVTQLLSASSPPDYPMPAAATWLLSVGRLRRQTAPAAQLLELCAFFAPEPITLSLLYSDEVARRLDPAAAPAQSSLLIGRLVRDIGRYALARVDYRQATFQVHRLVQAVLRDQLTPQQQADRRHDVHEVLARANPGNPDAPQNWDRYAELFAHIAASGAVDCGAEEVRRLIVDEVRYLRRRGDFRSSQQMAEQALPRWRERFGEDDSWTLRLGFDLANSMRALGSYQAARTLDAEILARMRRTLGDSHIYTLMTSSSLAADLRSLGYYRQAQEMDEDTLARLRTELGPDHTRTLMVANNVAESLLLAGQPGAARALHRETLTRSQRVRGADHPSTLFVANNLARDLRGEGRVPESVAVQRDTLARTQRVLGEGHASTLLAATNLAVSLRRLGELVEARELNDEAARRYRTLLGEDHPDVLSCRINLACDLFAGGDLEAALGLVDELFGRYRRVLGERHPSSLACANNLAVLLRANGDRDARRVAERALAGLAQALGEEHPYTLGCALNLANTLSDDGQYPLAREIDEQTYRRYLRTLGPAHPETLVCGSNLSRDLQATGDTDGASVLREEILRRCRESLGPANPITLRVIGGQRLDWDIEVPPV
ncbi:MAG TPA: FxSxx-COOH system tetratricopeptide repeat protein [Mycobacteriales bacterium]|nr:FxSxx-COOH system tetratricopeptide repeat protein [Mycobacteriales bacterium]